MENLKSKIELLNKLKPEDEPAWGRMTPQHMVEHLIYTFEGSNGKREFQCLSPAEKLPKLKRILMSDRPFPKGFITPLTGDKLMQLRFKNLYVSIILLKKEILYFHTYFENNKDARPINPTFGELNKEEWIQFHNKHINHHFSQFNLI